VTIIETSKIYVYEMDANERQMRERHGRAPPPGPAGLGDDDQSAMVMPNARADQKAESLDFSIFRRGSQQRDSCARFEIDEPAEYRSQHPGAARQSVDSQVSHGNRLDSNTFLFKNFSKLTKRAQDGNGPSVQKMASMQKQEAMQRTQSAKSRAMFGARDVQARRTYGGRRVAAPGSLASADGVSAGSNGKFSYQRHLEDRVRNSGTATRQSLHMVQQAYQVNNEANLERFYCAQEISQEIISGQSTSKRYTIDPSMMHGGLSSGTGCLSFGQAKAKIPFNPNSLGLNLLKEQMIYRGLTKEQARERKALHAMLSEVHHQNRPLLGAADDQPVAQHQQDCDRLLPKGSKESNNADLNRIENEEEHALEGGQLSYNLSNNLETSAQHLNDKLSIDNIFPQTIQQTSKQQRMKGSIKSMSNKEAQDGYEHFDAPRIRSSSCCTYVYDLFACLLWPIGWLLYHLFCCCACDKKKRMFSVPPHILQKHLKKRKHAEDTKTINAMI